MSVTGMPAVRIAAFTPAPLVSPDHARSNFGLIRFALATLVLVSHAFPLTRGSNLTEPLARATGAAEGLTLGQLAVDGFFLISGYLVTLSWRRTRFVGAYIRKRVLRIYPGYLAAFIVS